MAPFWHLFLLLQFWYLAISAAIEHGEVITTSTALLFNNQSATKQHEDECSSFICPGDGLFGDPCDCRNYYDCYSKFARQYKCPEGELWSQQLKACDWKGNVECTVDHSLIKSNQDTDVQRAEGTTECTNGRKFVSVCYYSNWAYWREGSGQYTVDDIDLDLCTHLVYAFAVLDGTSLTIKALDSWLDLPDGLDNYNKFTSLKNLKPGIKTTLAIGGWTDSHEGTKYSTLVSSAINRQNFIDHVIPFLKSYKFDGLDLDWEYPDSGNKANFGLFVKELKTAFEPQGLLLTAAVGASEARATTSYDIPTLSQYLDYIHLMTYDFHGSWESSADHHSKLYNDAGSLDADSTVKNWIASGASAGKLVLGVPLYGRSFTLSTSQKNPPAPASGGGTAGSITEEGGYLGYLEICTYISNGWTVVKDSSGARGPYAYSGNQWVGYDDVDMVRTKAQYVKSEGLGGTMVWAIDLADFNGVCPLGRYPLLNAMRAKLQTSTNCRTTESPVTQGPVTTESPVTTDSPVTQGPVTTESPVTQGPVTTEKPNTLQPSCSSQFACPGDGFWADPCDCQKYYQCYTGGVYHQSCPEGTLWNQEFKYCDWPYNVECNTGGPMVTEKSTTEQPFPTTEPECAYTFVCPEDGLWADPCDCQKYYQCSHGNGYQYSCGEGTLWFQTIKNCNWASHCNKASLPVCEGYATYVCSSATDTVYMMCSDGSTATFKCPINLAWSSSAMNCVPFSDPTAGC